MRAVRFHDHGGPDELAVEDVPRPDPGPDELLVRVEAASVNPVDTYFREGSYAPADLPWITGSDAAGVVEAVGAGVTEFTAGERVFATGLGNSEQGTCAEYVAVPAAKAAHLPDGIGFDEGAATGLVGVTAWQSLVAAAGLEPAETALIHGGSGGVGHVAVQLAASAGARVLTTAAPEYHDRVAALGAEAVLDYAADDLADRIEDEGNPDVILDHRLDEYLGLDCDVSASGGRIAAIGNEAPEATFPNVPAARAKALSVHHVSMFNTPDMGDVLSRLARLLEAGDLAPEIGRRFDLEEVPKAQRAVLEDSVLGKLVVEP